MTDALAYINSTGGPVKSKGDRKNGGIASPDESIGVLDVKSSWKGSRFEWVA